MKNSIKKLFTAGVAILAISSLSACSTNITSKSSNNSNTVQKDHNQYYFNGKTVNIHDVKIHIDKVQFYKASEATGNKDLICFDYTITNKTNKDINAIEGWQAVFNAYQDNKNTEGKLEVGALPPDTNDQVLHDQDQTIKKNGTVKCRAAYELDSASKPVVLKATQGTDGKFLGKKIYKLNKLINKNHKSNSSTSSSKSDNQTSTQPSATDKQVQRSNDQQSNDSDQDQRPSDVPANFKEYTSYTTDGHKMTQWNDDGSYCGDPDVQYQTAKMQTDEGF